MAESSNKTLVREWFALAHSGGRWALADDELIIKTPYAPPGLPTIMSGIPECREVIDKVQGTFKSFAWLDLEVFETDRPDVLFATTTSRAVTHWDFVYTNEYMFMIKLRNGKVLELTELFNPLYIIEALAEMKAHGASPIADD